MSASKLWRSLYHACIYHCIFCSRRHRFAYTQKPSKVWLHCIIAIRTNLASMRRPSFCALNIFRLTATSFDSYGFLKTQYTLRTRPHRDRSFIIRVMRSNRFTRDDACIYISLSIGVILLNINII